MVLIMPEIETGLNSLLTELKNPEKNSSNSTFSNIFDEAFAAIDAEETHPDLEVYMPKFEIESTMSLERHLIKVILIYRNSI